MSAAPRATLVKPCIDLHQGVVKQIVGSSLSKNEWNKDFNSKLSTVCCNFVSSLPATHYAEIFRKDNMLGGHVIMLGQGQNNLDAARNALATWPQGLHVGGGINIENAEEWLAAGASKVILTSWLFGDTLQLEEDRLRKISEVVGRGHFVVDLSCRSILPSTDCPADQKPSWAVSLKGWSVQSETSLDTACLDLVGQYCNEVLIHAVDVEGTSAGIEKSLVQFLGKHAVRRGGCQTIVYAGGVNSIDCLKEVEQLSNGSVDVTVGSSLDLYESGLSPTTVSGLSSSYSFLASMKHERCRPARSWADRNCDCLIASSFKRMCGDSEPSNLPHFLLPVYRQLLPAHPDAPHDSMYSIKDMRLRESMVNSPIRRRITCTRMSNCSSVSGQDSGEDDCGTHPAADVPGLLNDSDDDHESYHQNEPPIEIVNQGDSCYDGPDDEGENEQFDEDHTQSSSPINVEVDFKTEELMQEPEEFLKQVLTKKFLSPRIQQTHSQRRLSFVLPSPDNQLRASSASIGYPTNRTSARTQSYGSDTSRLSVPTTYKSRRSGSSRRSSSADGYSSGNDSCVSSSAAPCSRVHISSRASNTSCGEQSKHCSRRRSVVFLPLGTVQWSLPSSKDTEQHGDDGSVHSGLGRWSDLASFGTLIDGTVTEAAHTTSTRCPEDLQSGANNNDDEEDDDVHFRRGGPVRIQVYPLEFMRRRHILMTHLLLGSLTVFTLMRLVYDFYVTVAIRSNRSTYVGHGELLEKIGPKHRLQWLDPDVLRLADHREEDAFFILALQYLAHRLENLCKKCIACIYNNPETAVKCFLLSCGVLPLARSLDTILDEPVPFDEGAEELSAFIARRICRSVVSSANFWVQGLKFIK